MVSVGKDYIRLLLRLSLLVITIMMVVVGGWGMAVVGGGGAQGMCVCVRQCVRVCVFCHCHGVAHSL